MFGFATPDVGWTLLAFRVQKLMSCSWVVQSLAQKRAGQHRAAEPASEVVGAEPHKGPVGCESQGQVVRLRDRAPVLC